MTRSSLLRDVRLSKSLPPPAEARALRINAGLSQSRLADEVGVHRGTLIRWENGTHRPRGLLRLRYAEVLEELRKALAT